jgi:long-chain acyl-CoA synthetase
MLFERWREIARSCRDEIALRDLAAGGSWTFGELAAAAETGARGTDRVAFPQGHSTEFILEVLRAWRAGQVVCPLEPNQDRPLLEGKLPAGIVHLKTTSATTGAPQLVAFTPEQLIADAENIATTMGLRADWPNLGVISLAHSYGFSNLVLPLLLHGIPLVLVGATLPEAVRRGTASGEPFTLAAVPALWRAWHEAGAIPENVRLAISAGAPLSLSLEQSVFWQRGLKLHNFYGSTECGGIVYDASDKPRADGFCLGGPLNNVQVSIAADGCLEVRGSAVGKTHWPESKPTLSNGVFHSSDLAEIADGFIYFRGRACDRINIAGRKVSPETIERALAAHPQVRECMAFGIPSADAERGETIVACLAARGEITGDSLKQYLMAQLPAWQVPREWWIVESLETNGRGKISRGDWRKRYLERNEGKQ